MCDVGLGLFWEDLLEYIEDGRVIPIVGQELLEVDFEGERIPLYRLVARQLGTQLGIPADDLPAEATINDIVCLHLQNRGRREDVYPRINRIMKNLAVEPPEALRKLASIKYFDLIISVTFDSLLVRALEEARGAGGNTVREIAYSPSNVQDLPADWRGEISATVFHLLGKVSPSPDYVTTEEDMLEFLYSLQSDARRPNLLFDELKGSHLLIIGCELSDWLARFFIRIAKNSKLSQQRVEMEVVVDSRTAADSNLALFLSNFSYSTKLLPGSPNEFVDNLYEEMKARDGVVGASSDEGDEAGDANEDDGAAGHDEDVPEMQEGSIFISYASEDLQAATELRDFLDEAGLDVWLDKGRLEPGDRYSAKIRRHIKNCSFFIPVISSATTQRLEGFFRREWKWALDRAEEIADHIPFILPVVIDDTAASAEELPDKFEEFHWTRLVESRNDDGFGMFMVKQMRNYHKRMRG